MVERELTTKLKVGVQWVGLGDGEGEGQGVGSQRRAC